jgi:hypothetical protein
MTVPCARRSSVDDQAEYRGPEGRPFAVADSIYCCWDFDHGTRTLEYLEGIDPDYFSTIATFLAQQLESKDAIAISVALRVLYHQGVETLMSLLGAAAQGAAVVPAWIAKCSTADLKVVVARLQSGHPLLTEVGTQRVTFDGLSSYVHRFVWAGEVGVDSTAARFGRFWHRLAGELLDDTARAEYNALKHGSRVLPGGFSISIGLQEGPGIPAPSEQMHSIGGSKFGSTFFVAEPVGTAKWHVRTRRTSVNWLPEPLAQRLALMSISISNVIGALRCEHGVDPTTVSFVRPTPPDSFDDVWKHSLGVTRTSMDSSIGIEPADELSRDELRDLLKGRTDDRPPPASL